MLLQGVCAPQPSDSSRPKKKFKLKVAARLATGEVITSSRKYRGC